MLFKKQTEIESTFPIRRRKMIEKWMKFAFGEGIIRATSLAVMKLVGISIQSSGLAFATFYVLIVGSIQATAGAFFAVLGVAKKRKKDREPQKQNLVWEALKPPTRGSLVAACGFGLSATIMSIMPVLAFTYNADMGIWTFLITISIVPGAFYDWIFFGHPLKLRQWFAGIPMFILAGWCMLDFPDLAGILAAPVWLAFAGVNVMLAATNEALSQASVKLSPMQNNFWVGLTTVVASLIGLFGIAPLFGVNVIDLVASAEKMFWIASFATGGLVVVMISFKLVTYQMGGSIAIKKVVDKGTHLVLSSTMGIILYNEPLSLGKIMGVTLFFAAFTLMDNKTWDFVSKKIFTPATNHA